MQNSGCKTVSFNSIRERKAGSGWKKIIPGGYLLNDLYTITPSQIVMYTTEYCSDCLRARMFFETNKIEYIKVNLENNPKATEFVMQVNHGNRSVPTIIFPDGSILVEPSWEELKQKFSNS